MSIASMMDATCNIVRPSIGQEATYKGTLQNFAVPPATQVQLNMPCSIQQQSISVVNEYGQRNTEQGTTAYFYEDPQTTVSDLMTVTPNVGPVSQYRVQGQAQYLGRGRVWQVSVTRLEQP